MPKKPSALYPSLEGMQNLEDNGMTFRLKQISETRSFFESEHETS